MLTEVEAYSCTEIAEPEKNAVRQQLERLLSNAHFSHSRRFPQFLRFIVECVLTGEPDLLKERTLGIEIFGRAVDYDTGSDPIVRVTAAEIRKRIALYYQDPGHEGELHIEIPRGTYVPRFFWPCAASVVEEGPLSVPAPAPETLERLLETPAPAPRPHRRRLRRVIRSGILIAGALFVLLAAICLFLWRTGPPSALAFFWAPVLRSNDPLLFCVADQDEYSTIDLRDASDPSRRMLLRDSLTAVVLEDMNPVMKIEGVLEPAGKTFSLRAADTTSLTDLRNGSNIFIGSFDNPWTLRLTRSLRYHFFNDPNMTEFGIVDSHMPEDGRWMVHRQQQMATNNYRDFALVARFADSTTGRLTIVAAGVARGGTIVAGEFLTSADDLAKLAHLAAREGNAKNMEVVLSTQILDGNAAAPKIEAAYFW